MNNKRLMEMCANINMTVEICQKYLIDDSYELYHSRYEKLLETLNKVKQAVVEDCLYTEVSDLSITRMIIDNDPKDLYESVLKTNLYFRENFSSVL